MSNDRIPDWAITTGAHLLKRGWSSGKKKDGGCGAKEMTEEPISGNSIFFHIFY